MRMEVILDNFALHEACLCVFMDVFQHESLIQVLERSIPNISCVRARAAAVNWLMFYHYKNKHPGSLCAYLREGQ